MSYEIDITSRQTQLPVSIDGLESAIEFGLRTEAVAEAILSVTVVDNATMHALNRQHLEHDYPTDVISFQLEWTCDGADLNTRCTQLEGRSSGAAVEGEIVVSAEYAAEMAKQCGWSTQDELTLYAIHGMLHICGYDDLTPEEKSVMRLRERAILEGLGLSPQYPDD